jgi:geranylgeranylglycerol-phosphate geranylgeranyltransferase
VQIFYLIRDIAKLIRLVNCLIASAGVLVGAYLTDGDYAGHNVVLAAVAVFFACGAGNIINDILDLASDRISHPDRVLVRGGVSRLAAGLLAAVMLLVGITLLVTVNRDALLWGMAGIGAIMLYDVVLKRVVLLGNAMVAVSAGLTFMVGGAAAEPSHLLVLPGPLLPALLAVLFHIVREIVKDVEDIEGDKAVGILKLPARIGIRPSMLTALGVLVGLVVLTSLPFFWGWFGVSYLIVAIVMGELPLIGLLAALSIGARPGLLRFTASYLKVGMVLGLVGLVIGRR